MPRSAQDLVRGSLDGKVALVTGACSGIGLATARLLADAGASVALLDWSARELGRAARNLRRGGADALPIIADVSRAAQMKRALRELTRWHSRLDIVVANAGINGLWAPLEEIEPAEWDHTLNVNLKGTFLTLKYAVPWLKRSRGAVVVVSSVNGTRVFSNAGASAYATSKGGQLAFARMAALELAPAGIRVNTVCPGSTHTNIFATTRRRHLSRLPRLLEFPRGHVPLAPGEMATPERIADVIWYLCSPLASHVSGAEVFVDAAESLLRG